MAPLRGDDGDGLPKLSRLKSDGSPFMADLGEDEGRPFRFFGENGGECHVFFGLFVEAFWADTEQKNLVCNFKGDVTIASGAYFGFPG
jgi:hypothetical protein